MKELLALIIALLPLILLYIFIGLSENKQEKEAMKYLDNNPCKICGKRKYWEDAGFSGFRVVCLNEKCKNYGKRSENIKSTELNNKEHSGE